VDKTPGSAQNSRERSKLQGALKTPGSAQNSRERSKLQGALKTPGSAQNSRERSLSMTERNVCIESIQDVA